MSPRFLLGLAALAVAAPLATTGCENRSCTSLWIVREMPYQAKVPEGVDVASSSLEVCLGAVCDVARLAPSMNPSVSGLRCEDVDGRTPTFPTQCRFDPSDRTLSLSTNTVYGGHAGSDVLVLTAVAPSGSRTEILRGTVSYADTTDDAARGACTDAYQGTFAQD